jgi:hypothetical protein
MLNGKVRQQINYNNLLIKTQFLLVLLIQKKVLIYIKDMITKLKHNKLNLVNF